jgi:hypothetical protein
MIHPTEYQRLIVNAHHDELMRRADRTRLVREALGGERGRVAIYRPLLRGLGARLVLWGTALQTRYADGRAALERDMNARATDTLAIKRAR